MDTCNLSISVFVFCRQMVFRISDVVRLDTYMFRMLIKVSTKWLSEDNVDRSSVADLPYSVIIVAMSASLDRETAANHEE